MSQGTKQDSAHHNTQSDTTHTPADPAASEQAGRHHALRVFDPQHRAELARHLEAANRLLFGMDQGLIVACGERGDEVGAHISTTVAAIMPMLADLSRWVAAGDVAETPAQTRARVVALRAWADADLLALAAA